MQAGRSHIPPTKLAPAVPEVCANPIGAYLRGRLAWAARPGMRSDARRGGRAALEELWLERVHSADSFALTWTKEVSPDAT